MISILKLRKLFSFCYCSLRHVQFLFNATPIVCAYIFSFSQAKENTYEVISTVIIGKTHTHFLFFKIKIQAYIENAESHCSRFLTFVLLEFWNKIFTFIFFCIITVENIWASCLPLLPKTNKQNTFCTYIKGYSKAILLSTINHKVSLRVSAECMFQFGMSLFPDIFPYFICVRNADCCISHGDTALFFTALGARLGNE